MPLPLPRMSPLGMSVVVISGVLFESGFGACHCRRGAPIGEGHLLTAGASNGDLLGVSAHRVVLDRVDALMRFRIHKNNLPHLGSFVDFY
jgi:hypothetical protein